MKTQITWQAAGSAFYYDIIGMIRLFMDQNIEKMPATTSAIQLHFMVEIFLEAFGLIEVLCLLIYRMIYYFCSGIVAWKI